MSSIDQDTLHYLDGAVKALVQQRRSCTDVKQIIDRLIERAPMLNRAYFESNENLLANLWIKHTSGRDIVELPPSPPGSEGRGRHRDSNGSSVSERPGSAERLIIPAEDQLNTARVSVHIYDDKLKTWRGTMGRYGSRRESFISQNIVDRLKLSANEERVQLTWVLDDESTTNRTVFIVVPPEDLSGDCLLGKHCKKREEEIEEQLEDDERQSEEGQAQTEQLIDTSLCRIQPMLPQGIDTFDTLARMNAISLKQFLSDPSSHRTAGSGE